MADAASGLKNFYMVLGVVAVIGVGAIVFMSQRGSSPSDTTTLQEPVSLAADDSFTGYVKGSPDAPVEVTEFSDFECPFCARFFVVQMLDIDRRLIQTGLVRWRFRDYPLDSHSWARLAALASHCAAEQDQFWPMHDSLFVYQRDWTGRRRGVDRIFKRFADGIGLDDERFDACLDSQRYMDRVNSGLNEGRGVPVTGTPTFTVNGVRVPSVPTADELVRIVDSITAAAAQ